MLRRLVPLLLLVTAASAHAQTVVWEPFATALPDSGDVDLGRALAASPDGVLLYGAGPDAFVDFDSTAGLYRLVDSTGWQPVYQTNPRALLFAGPDTAYAATLPDATLGVSGGVFRSDDAGQTWQDASSGLDDLSVYALARDTSAGTLYAGTPSGVFASEDDGESWSLLVEGIDVGALAVGGDGSLWIGDYNASGEEEGVVVLHPDSMEVEERGLDGQQVNALLVLPDSTVLAGVTPRLGQETPSIQRWTPATDGWDDTGPSARMNTFARLPDGTLWAGGPFGAYVSTNDGASWSDPVALGFGRGGGGVAAFAFHPVDERLYLAETFTDVPVYRSEERVTVARQEQADEPSLLLTAAPNPARYGVTVRFALLTAGRFTLHVYDALGREAAVLADGTGTAGAHHRVWDLDGLASGVYLVRLQAAGRAQTALVTVVR